MGRKGASKRKSDQTKSKPFANGKAGGSGGSTLQSAESRLNKAVMPDKIGAKSAEDRKKNPRQG